MKNMVYTSQPENEIGRIRLVTRSLLLLALLTATIYLTVIPSKLEVNSEVGMGFLSLLFLLTAIIGLIVVWKWEGLGGAVVLVSGIGLAILTFVSANNTPILTAFFYGSPFIITGCLSLICWWKEK